MVGRTKYNGTFFMTTALLVNDLAQQFVPLLCHDTECLGISVFDPVCGHRRRPVRGLVRNRAPYPGRRRVRLAFHLDLGDCPFGCLRRRAPAPGLSVGPVRPGRFRLFSA